MHRERLLLLADALRHRIPAENFDISDWRTRIDAGDDYDYEAVTAGELLEHKCGAAACAVGWACVLPEFVAQGLHADGMTPRFQHREHWDAVRKFFEISEETSDALFSGAFHPFNVTPVEVAERIELALQNEEAAHDAGLEYFRQR